MLSSINILSPQTTHYQSHTHTDKWDAYGYNRHFTFKCHKKYEEERLNETEANRLKEAHDTYVRMHPEIAEASIRKRRKLNAKDGEKLLSVEELRVQENMWKEKASEKASQCLRKRNGAANEAVAALVKTVTATGEACTQPLPPPPPQQPLPSYNNYHYQQPNLSEEAWRSGYWEIMELSRRVRESHSL